MLENTMKGDIYPIDLDEKSADLKLQEVHKGTPEPRIGVKECRDTY